MTNFDELPAFHVDLGGFAADLRCRCFRTAIAAARYYKFDHGTISRYEDDKVRPSIGYIAHLAYLLVERLEREGQDVELARGHLLRQVNQAIKARYQDEPPIKEWSDLVRIADEYLSERLGTSNLLRATEAKAQSGSIIAGSLPGSCWLELFPLKCNRLTAVIHDEYSLMVDDNIRRVFNQLNLRRPTQGLWEHYAASRYRLIRPPLIKDEGYVLHVAPMNFAHFWILEDPLVPTQAKKHVRREIDQIARRIPGWLQSDDAVFNGHNCHPVGVEVVLITKDHKTLLRKRGASVLKDAFQWDVSFSGFCGAADRLGDELRVGSTVEHEMNREIGLLAADPRDITFTGLYRREGTDGMDILAYWRIEAKSDEVEDMIAAKWPKRRGVFKTTKRAEEQFVWDTENRVVEFDGPAIANTLGRIESPNDRMIPEALACLVLALKHTGGSTSGLSLNEK